jgi:hypothetical protein
MTTPERELPPASLRQALLADMDPVRPLRPPLVRSAVLVPLGLLLLAAQPLVLGVRSDAAAVGALRLWALSLLQCLGGFALFVAALREAVPGRSLRRAGVPLALGLLAMVAVTFLTWQASGTTVPPGRFGFFWTVCFTAPFLLGLPVLALALLLAWRAYPLRPALVGALSGLGAGLVTDAGWRTFCHVADPLHVLSAHFAAVLALCAAGAMAGAVLAARRR